MLYFLRDAFGTYKLYYIWQGAVENLIERSSFIQLLDGSIVELDQASRDTILQSLHKMSSSALRCLGFAYKENLPEFDTYNGDEDHPAHQLLLNPSNYSSIESNLIFVGLAGLRVSGHIFFPLLKHIVIVIISLLFTVSIEH